MRKSNFRSLKLEEYPCCQNCKHLRSVNDEHDYHGKHQCQRHMDIEFGYRLGMLDVRAENQMICDDHEMEFGIDD